MINVNGLTKKFGDFTAVDNVSFEINRGEVVGFLGPNGAGKTTTMRMISGFLYPDEGDATVAGISITKNPVEARKHIGYLPENNPLYKSMMVSEMLSLTADLRGISKEERQDAYDFVVASSGISDVFYRPIMELSKGYKQRVGIALALLHKPEIIIMDEPTEGLDPNQRVEIRALINDLAKNHTVILSTHVMQEASAVCSRLLVINKGKMVSDGKPSELIHNAQEEKIIHVNIEGTNIKYELENIPGVKKVELISEHGGRFEGKIISDQYSILEPKISEFVRTKNWTIWKLSPLEKGLEDVFRELTSKKSDTK